jgi:hypothetical protein
LESVLQYATFDGSMQVLARSMSMPALATRLEGAILFSGSLW